jgi:hypothetical protein
MQSVRDQFLSGRAADNFSEQEHTSAQDWAAKDQRRESTNQQDESTHRQVKVEALILRNAAVGQEDHQPHGSQQYARQGATGARNGSPIVVG